MGMRRVAVDLRLEVDDEFPGAALRLCRRHAGRYAEHPAFVGASQTYETLLLFFYCKCLCLLTARGQDYIQVVGRPPQAGTDDAFRLRLVFRDEELGRDLTRAAFDRLIGHG